jgi:anti-sigma regulatory factor (Ser/Thr protein kinase)
MASADRPGTSTDGAAPHVRAVALDQTFDADTLFQLRSAVAAHGADLGLTEPALGDLVLVAHELASNAVRHGHANADDPGRLRLWRDVARDGDAITCEVSDHGPGLSDPANAGRTRAPIGAAGGRGLWIVRQVMRDLDIRTGPTGTTVTASLPLKDAN